MLHLTRRRDSGSISLRAYESTHLEWTRTSAHDGLEVTWARRGALLYRLGSKELVVPEGAAVVVPPSVEHQTAVSEGGQAEAIHLGVEVLRLLAEELGLALVTRGLAPGIILNASALARDCRWAFEHANVSALAADDFVLELLRRRLHDDRLEEVRDRRIAKAIERACMAGDAPTVEELSHSAGMTRFHFSREFKGRTGKSPHQYVLNVRLQYAMYLLKSGECDLVTEAASRAGFNDFSRFAQQFRRAFGAPPRQILREARAPKLCDSKAASA